jgi:hypothetical protein
MVLPLEPLHINRQYVPMVQNSNVTKGIRATNIPFTPGYYQKQFHWTFVKNSKAGFIQVAAVEKRDQ